MAIKDENLILGNTARLEGTLSRICNILKGPEGSGDQAGPILSATTRMRDGVPNAFCMPYSCLSDKN